MAATLQDIIVVKIQRPGVDGTGITPAEKTQLVTDVATALARPDIRHLEDLEDVSGGQAVGETIVWDGTNWVPGQPVGSIGVVYDHTDTPVITEATSITAKGGLTARAGTGPNAAVIEALIGTAANTVAAGNHTHAIRIDTQLTFPSSGSFSSGTRTLVSGNVTGLDAAKSYVLKGTLEVQLRGDGAGAGRTRPRITINGNSVDIPEPPRNVAGVQPQFTVRHPGVVVSGVSSVAVAGTIAYVDGDPTWIGGGALTISIESNR